MEDVDPYDIEKAYVCGEVVGRRPDGSLRIQFPTIRTLAVQFGVKKSFLARLSKRNGWVNERQRHQAKVRSLNWDAVARARAAGDDR